MTPAAVLRGGGGARGPSAPIVLLSARGAHFAHADAVRYAAGEELTLLCGHYKDVDQRVADHLATEERSLGDFVLSGGEPAALAVIDATVRLLPGAMSDLESARSDSFYERRVERAELYAAAGVSGACGAGGAAVGRPQADRGVAADRGRAADPGAGGASRESEP